MTKFILLHSLIFFSFHFLGGLPTALQIVSTDGNTALSNAPIEQVLSSLAIYSIMQYIGLVIISSIVFVIAHVKMANWLANHPLKKISPIIVHLSWSILSTLSLLIINTSTFNRSIFYIPEHLVFTNTSIGYIFFTVLIASPLILLTYTLWRRHLIMFIALSSLILITTIAPLLFSTPQTARTDKPNIILIGIDSLRLELIAQYMPTLSKQLESASLFENAYTPLARTYPAWMSILSGRHPATSNARYNLQPESMLSSDNHYLAGTLKQLGYHSIYASDERRFSNIGSSQGFEQVIGPNTGAADFILGEYADFPLLNVLTKLPIAKWLTPEIYANRAASHLYQPKQFSNLLSDELSNLEDAPLLLATHFCLPHWPFTFVGHEDDSDYSQSPAYPDTLRAVDEQIADLLQQLDKQGLLNNSRLIFLSDHGESWGNVDTLLKSGKGHTLLVNDYGHGMNILSSDSHKVLMAFKGFNLPKGKSQRLTSLIDISPTITGSLNIPPSSLNYDGHSLLDTAPAQIEISFESGLVLAAANQAKPDPDKVAQAGLHHYQVLKNGLLRLKEESVEKMLSQKQLGLRQNQLGLFRGSFVGKKMNYLLINYQSLHYSQIPHLSDAHKLQPSLTKSFCNLYAASQPQISEECVNL